MRYTLNLQDGFIILEIGCSYAEKIELGDKKSGSTANRTSREAVLTFCVKESVRKPIISPLYQRKCLRMWKYTGSPRKGLGKRAVALISHNRRQRMWKWAWKMICPTVFFLFCRWQIIFYIIFQSRLFIHCKFLYRMWIFVIRVLLTWSCWACLLSFS